MVFKNILVVIELDAQNIYIAGFPQWQWKSEKVFANTLGQVRSHLLQELKQTKQNFCNLGSGFHLYLTGLWDALRSLTPKHQSRSNIFYLRH